MKALKRYQITTMINEGHVKIFEHELQYRFSKNIRVGSKTACRDTFGKKAWKYVLITTELESFYVFGFVIAERLIREQFALTPLQPVKPPDAEDKKP